MKLTTSTLKAFIVFFALFGVPAAAQTIDTCPNFTSAGHDFWVAFLINGGDQRPQITDLFVFGDTACTVTVNNPLTSWSQTIDLEAHSSAIINLPNDAIPENYSVTESKGFHITSTSDIQVVALFTQLAASDATRVLPTQSLGNRYIVLDYPADPGRTDYTGATAIIVATEPATTIQYTPPYPLQNAPRTIVGTTVSHVFNSAGETLLLMTKIANATLSGMEITSDKPIAVFQGNQMTGVPLGNASGDFMYEQSLPVPQWGKTFGLVSTHGRSVGDRIRVVADSACTVTLSNGSYFSIADHGVNEIDLPANNPCILTADKPVSVGLCLKGSTWNGEPGDASLLVVPALEKGIRHAVFTTITTQRIHNRYLTAITNQPSTMTLDGNSIASQFTPIGSTGYSYARISVNSGIHTLDNSQGTFSAWTYGLGNVESYCYSLGQPLNSFIVDTTTPVPQPQPQTHRDTVAFYDSVCQGHAYNNNGFSIGVDETQVATILSRMDSTVVDDTTIHYRSLTLTVLPTASEVVNTTLPTNGILNFGDTVITDSGTYVFHLTAANGCDSTLTLHVQFCDASICFEFDGLPFIDFDHPVVLLQDCSPNRQSTRWEFSDGYQISGERARRLFKQPLPDTVIVTLTTCNKDGCCADTTFGFAPKIRSVWFPNIFFPDQEINNTFGCYTSYEVVNFELEIYNRWGFLLWSTTDISAQWDGTYNGKPVPQGAYVYKWFLEDIYGDYENGIGTVSLVR